FHRFLMLHVFLLLVLYNYHVNLVSEITCEYPRDQHVSRSYYWGTMKLGEKQSYSCASGYRKKAAEATCTQDGWTPKPLCAEIMCDLPKFPNAEIVGSQNSNYKINSRIQYKCRSGFEPEEPVQIICDSQGQMLHVLQQCVQHLTSQIGIMLKWKSNEKIISTHNEAIDFACQSGKKFKAQNLPRSTCNDGVINLPECEE
uniref:Sushi domain-containing protein n=1 Tax=Cyprinus carpio TaxID=7962 RepID=A0A8C1LXP3_CYPCA